MKPAHACVEKNSGSGRRVTHFDSSGPVVSVWSEQFEEAWHEAAAMMARLRRRERKRMLSVVMEECQ